MFVFLATCALLGANIHKDSDRLRRCDGNLGKTPKWRSDVLQPGLRTLEAHFELDGLGKRGASRHLRGLSLSLGRRLYAVR